MNPKPCQRYHSKGPQDKTYHTDAHLCIVLLQEKCFCSSGEQHIDYGAMNADNLLDIILREGPQGKD